MKMENPENVKALNNEELEKVAGGWNIFSPMKEAVKSTAEWSYDNIIGKPGEELYGALKGGEKAYGYDPDAPAFAPAKEG